MAAIAPCTKTQEYLKTCAIRDAIKDFYENLQDIEVINNDGSINKKKTNEEKNLWRGEPDENGKRLTMFDNNIFAGFPSACPEINPDCLSLPDCKISKNVHTILYALFEDADKINLIERKDPIGIKDNGGDDFIFDLITKLEENMLNPVYLNNINVVFC